MPVNRLTNELYIMPSFFSEIIKNQRSEESIHEIENAYEQGDFDQYTEIKKNNGDTNILLSFRKVRFIPLSNSELDYNEDVWDFSQYILTNKHHKKFRFENVPNEFKNNLKDQILMMILVGTNKFSTIYRCFTNLRVFLDYCHSHGIVEMIQIDNNIVDEFLKSLDVAIETFISYQSAIKKMLGYYDAEYGTNVYTSQIENLCKRMDAKQYKAYKEQAHRKAIPMDYFNILVQTLIDTMNDGSKTVMERAYAAILVIDSQTGLRASELSLLKINAVETVDLDGEKARMINYEIVKTAHGEGNTIPAKTYLNDLAFAAYKCLSEILEPYRKKRNSDYLFCSKSSKLPHPSDSYVKRIRKICVFNYDKLFKVGNKFKEYLSGNVSIKQYCKDNYKGRALENTPLRKFINAGMTSDAVIYFPVVHQFRDTVVQALLDEGVDIEYIREYMGHLSVETTAGYAGYGKEKLQENKKYSDDILKAYLVDKEQILGNNGQAMMDAIDKVIKDDNLNIYKDLDGVINALEKLIPIRAKHGGVCIKGSKLSDACSIDADTDEFYCAYGICPNSCHFYFMLDVAYSDFKANIDIYQYNVDNGFKRQAKKERKKINALIVNRLNPEIEDLEREIAINGAENIKERHPNISDIIDSLSSIKEEIDKWKLAQA